MRARGLVSMAMAALAVFACTKDNANYCAEAGTTLGYNCVAWDAARHDRHDAATEVLDAEDASDANDGDGAADLAEAMPEVKPVCVMDMDCAGKDAGTPACDMSDGGAKCVECTDAKHCTDSKKPVCDKTAEKCVECVGTGTECTGTPGKSVCNTMTQSCVECLDNSKCAGTTPICGTSTNKCRGCNADTECKGIGPEICVDWDGHCATNAEVVTLQGGAACTPSPSTGVFCRPADALMARPVNGILLVKGPDAVGMIEPVTGPTAGNMLILGRGGAFVAAGAGDAAGIHLAGALKFWVRDIKVSGGTIGVLADFSTEAHLTRCTIILNPKGGIKTSTASFDITNTLVSGNGPGTDLGGVVWGGVRLGDKPIGSLGRFENNTVVDNASIGVSCASSTSDISTSIVYGNQGGESGGCSGVACCGANADPKLDSSLRLMSGSPCIDKLTATAMTPAVDIDGQARPTAAGKLDCGADEFQ